MARPYLRELTSENPCHAKGELITVTIHPLSTVSNDQSARDGSNCIVAGRLSVPHGDRAVKWWCSLYSRYQLDSVALTVLPSSYDQVLQKGIQAMVAHGPVAFCQINGRKLWCTEELLFIINLKVGVRHLL